MSDAQQLLDEYGAFISLLEAENIPAERPKRICAERLLRALVLRDSIQDLVRSNALIDQTSITTLYRLDQSLKSSFRSASLDFELAKKFRLLNPDCAARWWWDFDQVNPGFRCSVILRGIRIGMLWPLNIAIVASLIGKLLASESGILGLLGIAASVAIPVFQAQRQFGDAKTKPKEVNDDMSTQRVRRTEAGKLFWTLGATIVLSVMWVQLPKRVAYSYYLEGNENHVRDPEKAMAAYVKALALDPSLTRVNGSLGDLYETHLVDYEMALQSYRKASLRGDIVSLQRLARINLLHNPPNTYAAQVFLDKSIQQMAKRESQITMERDKYAKDMKTLVAKGKAGGVLSPDEVSKRYRIIYYSLQGWVNLLDKRLADAIDNLRLAIEIQESLPEDRVISVLRSPATPYCLLGQALQADKQTNDARKAWTKCHFFLTHPMTLRPDLTKLPEEITWLKAILPSNPDK